MEPQATKLARPPKGVNFPYRAIWDAECTSTFIKLRGIDLRGEFDVARGKHMENGWQMVRRAMCDKLGALAPWFVTGDDDFRNFCDEHNIDADAYLEEVFKIKATEKWKYLQEVFKEKKRGTVTVVDDCGKVVKKRANCTGEAQLDEVEWQFFDIMQQAMLHRASVCPPSQVILQNCTPSTKYVSCTDGPSQVCMDGKSGDVQCKVYENSPTAATDGIDYSKKKSTRPDEASSPVRKAAPPMPKGRRPSNADRRHDQVVSIMMEQSSTVQETVTHVTKSITDLQAKLQTNDREALILDRALKIQRSWDERFAFLAAQSIPLEVITSYIGPRPTADEAIQQVMSLQEALRKNC
eukprot:scaffold341_cov368-Pavlova_lutheri.AAC.15